VIKRQLFLFLISISVVFADETNESNGLKWLEKMNHAMKELNYQGTVAFMKNGQLDTMKYIHAANNGLEQERLLSLNSPMREVIRDSGKVSCTFKATNKRIVNHRPVSQSFIIDLPQQISSLADTYTIFVLGEESVAMRPSLVIAVQAKDDFRYDRKIWIDKQLFLPLKVEVYSLAGTTLEQVVFTDISVETAIAFTPLDDEDDRLDIQHIHQAPSESFDKASFVINNLPTGFEKVFFTRMSMHKSEQPVDHLLLSDGFASVSVYLDGKDEEIDNGLQTIGSVNSFSRVMDDYQIVVLGEVPAKTVEFIAQGISFNK
jgi:sigma-E factor negative regulatory protein RseB